MKQTKLTEHKTVMGKVLAWIDAALKTVTTGRIIQAMDTARPALLHRPLNKMCKDKNLGEKNRNKILPSIPISTIAESISRVFISSLRLPRPQDGSLWRLGRAQRYQPVSSSSDQPAPSLYVSNLDTGPLLTGPGNSSEAPLSFQVYGAWAGFLLSVAHSDSTVCFYLKFPPPWTP